MKYQNALITLGVAAIVIPLLKALYDWAQTPPPTTKIGNSPQVVKVVEQTLNGHKGEDSPFVQAFAEALEGEAQRDKAPGHAAGRRG